MTQDAQGALRRIMETYARITRFCLVCNYVTRIIEPLASRCSKFRFTPLDNDSASQRLIQIAQLENVAVSTAVINALITTSNGDLRRAITYLQSASRLASSSNPPTAILPSDIQEIAGVVPDSAINDFARSLGIEIEGDSIEFEAQPKTFPNSPFDNVRKQVKQLIREGYSASQALSQVRPLPSCRRARG